MKNLAASFELEWMEDGSLRLRFLDREENILGQQFVAAEALAALELLLSLAFMRACNADPQAVLELFRRVDPDVDISVVAALMDATRLCAGLMPEGRIGLSAREDDDS